MTTRILSDLEVDDPIDLGAGYRFNHLDRRLIDDQIRGVERHLVECLIRGRFATYVTVSGGSASLTPGDVVCRTASGGGTVTKATLSAISSVGLPLGVVLYAAPPGSKALVVTGGILPPTLTGLPQTAGFVRVNTTTGRLERRDTLGSGDYAVGTVGSDGYMQFVPDFGGGGGAITAEVIEWSPTSSPNSKCFTYQKGISTSLAIPATLLSIPIEDETAVDIEATVIGRGENSQYYRIDLRGGWERTAGVVTETDAPSTADPPSTGNPAGWSAALVLSGTNANVLVTGENGVDINWKVVADVSHVALPASSGPVPIVSGVSYGVVDTGGGGQRVVVTVDDSTGCVSISAGGVAFTSFAIDDATHVSGVPGAHAAGVVDVVVTNGNGPSTTGTGLIEYFSPHALSPTCELLPGAYAVTGTQTVDANGTWTDASGLGNNAFSPDGTIAPVVSGIGTPDFNGAASGSGGGRLTIGRSLASSGGSPPDLATLTAGTQIVFLEPDVSSGVAAPPYDDACVMMGSGASAGLTWSDSGLGWEAFDDGAFNDYRVITATAASAAAKHFTCARWNGSTWGHRANGGAFTNVTASASGLSNGNVGSTTFLGQSYAAARTLNGRINCVLVFASALSDGNVTKIYQWGRQRGIAA